MSAAQYEDRIRASWYGQIARTLMGFAFEHRAAAAALVDRIPDSFKGIPVDDDWYYQMALRAFERFGIGMSAAQLGEQWELNNAGTWGSSEGLKAFARQTVTIRLIQRVLSGPSTPRAIPTGAVCGWTSLTKVGRARMPPCRKGWS